MVVHDQPEEEEETTKIPGLTISGEVTPMSTSSMEYSNVQSGVEHPEENKFGVEHPTNKRTGVVHPDKNQPGMALPDKNEFRGVGWAFWKPFYGIFL